MLLILAHEKVENSLCYMYRAKPNDCRGSALKSYADV